MRSGSSGMRRTSSLGKGLHVAWACVIVSLLGCDPNAERIGRPRPTSPVARSYVAIGDALTAGVQSGALAKRHQLDSFPSILSLHLGIQASTTSRLTPLIANPGFPFTRPIVGAGYLDVVDLWPLVLARVPWEDPGLASERVLMHQLMELNRTQDVPFRNLGVPGAFAYDVRFAVDSLTTWTGVFAGQPNYFFETVLKPSVDTDSTTVLEDAMGIRPSLVTVWLGTSEIAAFATSGGGSLAYDAAAFGAHLEAIFDSLLATGSRVVAGTVPDVTKLPFFSTLPPVVTDARGSIVPHPVTSAPIPLLGEGGPPSDLEPGVSTLVAGSSVLLSAREAIARGAGVPDVVLVAAIVEQEGVDESTALALLPQVFPDHGTPLDGALTLTPAERGDVVAAVDAYDAAIRTAAAGREVVVAELRALFDRFDEGFSLGGVALDDAYVSGELISLDGIHPTSLGYAFIAQELIDVVNAAFGADVPSVDMGPYLNPPDLP